MNAIERSKCLIEAMLADIGTTYKDAGGGGISQIRMESTDVYTVSILQEKRVDLLTYELAVDAAGTVRIVKRTEATRTPGR